MEYAAIKEVLSTERRRLKDCEDKQLWLSGEEMERNANTYDAGGYGYRGVEWRIMDAVQEPWKPHQYYIVYRNLISEMDIPVGYKRPKQEGNVRVVLDVLKAMDYKMDYILVENPALTKLVIGS